MQLDNNTYLAHFAARELGPEHFDHRGHLHMAWLHLTRYDVEEASQRVCEGNRDLAAKFGAPEKYHRTLSDALVRIMAERMEKEEDFDAFLVANPDLLSDCQGVLTKYYSDERLHSAAAHTGLLEPERLPLNG